MSIKSGLKPTPMRLLALIESYLDRFKALYGKDQCRPKHHYILHLPQVLARHGDLVSTLTNERRHKVVKRYTRDRLCGKKWELGSLEEVVCQQIHECSSDWYSTTLINPHPPNQILQSSLCQLWSEVDSFRVAARGRGKHGQVSCGDFVWYDCTPLGQPGLRLGSLVLLVDADGAEVAMVKCCAPVTHDAVWPAFRGTDDLVVISLDCILCSTVYRGNDANVSCHRPLYLRN